VRSILLFLVSVLCAFSQKAEIQEVHNAASGASSDVVPQMLVSIVGENLAAQATSANGFPLPTQLAGTSVTFDGIAAPLLFVSPNQINAQVPSAVQGLTSTSLVVTTAAGAGTPFPVGVSSGRVPGIFTADSTGCGQAAALNVHADGSMSPNTPQSSFDPLVDSGLAFFATGIGLFPDRADGEPWQFNPADNRRNQFGIIVGAIPGVNSYSNNLAIAYAGPAPDMAGVDQVNGIYFPSIDPTHSLPLAEGCRVSAFLSASGSSDLYSQLVNVSIHSGGGACVDPPVDSLGIVTWQRTVTSDTVGVTSTSNVAIQFLQYPRIVGFERPPVVSVSSFANYGFLRPAPGVCAASHPETLEAGRITITGPGFSSVSLQPQNQNGLISYQTVLPIEAVQGGDYSVTAEGGAHVGSFAAQATIPAPITITTDLQPGATITLPFMLQWTGGDVRSVVTVQLIARVPGQQARPILFATSSASDGTRPLPMPPPQVPFSFPLHTDVEVIVTQQPGSIPSQPFSVPGLTLGGGQTWNYVFDFKGLKIQ
jgi:uncharacterized protein (TIGR03437 family)